MIDDEGIQYLSGRNFKLWDYSPSFNRLLIRSPQTEQNKLNIDIVFWGVQEINIVSQLGEIRLDIEECEDNQYRNYLIHSNGQIYTIKAVYYKILTSDTDIFESPLNKL